MEILELTYMTESTLATISPSSSAAEKSAAAAALTTDVSAIVASIDTATASAKAAGGSKLVRRQAGSLTAALTTLITEINTIAETLVADLGLSTSSGYLSRGMLG